MYTVVITKAEAKARLVGKIANDDDADLLIDALEALGLLYIKPDFEPDNDPANELPYK